MYHALKFVTANYSNHENFDAIQQVASNLDASFTLLMEAMREVERRNKQVRENIMAGARVSSTLHSVYGQYATEVETTAVKVDGYTQMLHQAGVSFDHISDIYKTLYSN